MRNIIITGVTSGLGKELVEIFSKENSLNKLFLLGRNLDNNFLDLNCERLYEVNFAKINDNLITKIKNDLLNDINSSEELIFINCVGTIKPINFIENIASEEIVENININVMWPIILIKELICVAEKKGMSVRIINISSGAAFNPLPGWSLYSLSKSAINTFLLSVAKEKEEYKIVSIDPGVMDTKMQNYIRNVNINEKCFDYIDQFRKYKEDNILLKTEYVANKIVNNYVNNWTAVEFYERIINK